MGGNGSGDRLARGAHKAVFPPAGGNVSNEEWEKIFEGFDAEAYKKGDGDAKKPEPTVVEKEKTRRNR